MQFLRQSTVTDIVIGPLISSSDGITEETVAYNASGIAVGVYKNGVRSALTLIGSAGNEYWREDHGGYHLLTLSAADTGTLGRLRVEFVATGILSAWEDCQVLPAAVYDALIVGSTPLGTDGKALISTDDQVTAFGNIAAATITALESCTQFLRVVSAVAGKMVAVDDGEGTVTFTLKDDAGTTIETLTLTTAGLTTTRDIPA
jgi:hypothetical protein